jgi:carbamoyl-phosphate synthase small subunit
MAKTIRTGLIAFEDGTVFRGRAFGAVATNVGEACFNTSMTGYQEILTDPSYFSQIVTMTAVQIGNYGICPDDLESDGPKVKGFIVRELSPVASNWRSNISIQDYLEDAGIPGIEGVDTRAITKSSVSLARSKHALQPRRSPRKKRSSELKNSADSSEWILLRKLLRKSPTAGILK